MAGKGRGIAAFSFNLDALGITRGSMPESCATPQPLFPVTEYKPAPLTAGEDVDYMLALKQEIRGRMRGLPSNIKPRAQRAEVERYHEKYVRANAKVADEEWTPDWQRLPNELKPQMKKIRTTSSKKAKPVTSKDKENIMNQLDMLEKVGDAKSDDDETEEKKEKKAGEEEDEEVEGEVFDEEELEEENDYIASYFEDGDDYGAGSDDNMDEATY